MVIKCLGEDVTSVLRYVDFPKTLTHGRVRINYVKPVTCTFYLLHHNSVKL